MRKHFELGESNTKQTDVHLQMFPHNQKNKMKLKLPNNLDSVIYGSPVKYGDIFNIGQIDVVTIFH